MRYVSIAILLTALTTSPGVAQRAVTTEFMIDGMALSVTGRELAALTNVGALVRGRRVAAQDAALARARQVVRGGDARYVLAIYELEIGNARGDQAMRSRALDALIASGRPRGARLASFLDVRGGLAMAAGDAETAVRLWSRLVALRPGNAGALANLAMAHQARGDQAAAAAALRRAIAAGGRNGEATGEIWHRQQLSIAFHGRQLKEGAEAALALVRAYPTPRNWRDALSVYRQLAAPDGPAEIETLRLMRGVGALRSGDEYQRLAQLLERDGRAIEARATMNEAAAGGLIDLATPPAREIVAQIDRSASTPVPTRDSEPRTARLRDGASLALAGRWAEAEIALDAITGDDIAATLARFWLARLERPPAG